MKKSSHANQFLPPGHDIIAATNPSIPSNKAVFLRQLQVPDAIISDKDMINSFFCYFRFRSAHVPYLLQTQIRPVPAQSYQLSLNSAFQKYGLMQAPQDEKFFYFDQQPPLGEYDPFHLPSVYKGMII